MHESRYLMNSDDYDAYKARLTITNHKNLPNMQSLTQQTYTHGNAFPSLQFKGQPVQFSNNSIHTPIACLQAHQQQRYEAFQPELQSRTIKFPSFYSCSTEGTEPDEEESNKENMQLWPISQFNPPSANRRSPLKDITSKILKPAHKRHDNSVASELTAYMDCLFSTQKRAGIGGKRGKLLRF